MNFQGWRELTTLMTNIVSLKALVKLQVLRVSQEKCGLWL